MKNQDPRQEAMIQETMSGLGQILFTCAHWIPVAHIPSGLPATRDAFPGLRVVREHVGSIGGHVRPAGIAGEGPIVPAVRRLHLFP